MNKEDNIKCVCHKNYNIFDFQKHFNKCKLFRNKFEKFDFKIYMTLKEYIVDKEDLNLVKFLLNRYAYLIDKLINIKIKKNTDNFPNQNTESIFEKSNKNKINNEYNNKPINNTLNGEDIQNNNFTLNNFIISKNQNNNNIYCITQGNDNMDKNKLNNTKNNEINFETDKSYSNQKNFGEFNKNIFVNPLGKEINIYNEQKNNFNKPQIIQKNNDIITKGKYFNKPDLERKSLYNHVKKSLRKLDEHEF